MHILCPICSDLVSQTENIYAIKCGHIFHYHCITPWINRSKSCPQCRIKVTNNCIFKLYPTISNENHTEDVTTLQSKLDDLQLQLRQEKLGYQEVEKKLKTLEWDLKKAEDMLQDSEKKLVTKSSAVIALKEQLKYVQIQNQETERLKEENEVLNKKLHTLNGLQKVLNASSEEIEQMLQGYGDARTLAMFATTLKRALHVSEKEKNEYRDQVQASKRKLSAEKSRVEKLQRQLKKLIACSNSNLDPREDTQNSLSQCPVLVSGEEKTKTVSDNSNAKQKDESFIWLVGNIENADSPYLNLKQSSLALSALQRRPKHQLPDRNLKPSEFAILNSVKSQVAKPKTQIGSENETKSIFHKKETIKVDFQENSNLDLDTSYNGLGGHSKLDVFPVPKAQPLKTCVPKLTAKHKLKRPAASNQDLQKYLKKRKD